MNNSLNFCIVFVLPMISLLHPNISRGAYSFRKLIAGGLATTVGRCRSHGKVLHRCDLNKLQYLLFFAGIII